MYTTIKISQRVKGMLDSMKFVDGESYEEVIEDLIEDHMDLNPEFEKGLEESIKQIKRGETVSFHEIKKKLKK